MATESYQTQLERVQATIAAIEEDGQEITNNGRRLTQADLPTLYKREARLRKLVDREAGRGPRQVVPR